MRALRACLLASLSVVAAAPAGAQKTLNVAVGGAFTSMDPHYHNLGPNNVLTQYVFGRLVRFGPDYQPEADLAVSWTPISPTVWEFKLRDGATFTDGTKLTPDDVLFTFSRIPQVLNSPSSFNFAVKPIVKTEVIDEHTMRFHTAEPVPLMPYNLANVAIVSRKYGEGAGTADYNSGKAAIGSGPYRVAEFIMGDHAKFVRNEGWWDTKPVWDVVNYRLIANDASRNAALQSGDVDIIDQVPTRDVADLRKNPKLSIVSAPSIRLIYIAVDEGRDQTPWAIDVNGQKLEKNPLKDVRVRRALSLAINRDAIRDRIMDGFSAPTGQLMPAGASGYDPAIKPDPYKPDESKKLLVETGYPNGFGITLHGPNDRYVNDSRISEAIAQMWTRVGVKTAVEAMPSTTYFSRSIRFEFSIRLTGWASDTGEDGSNLMTLVASSNPDKGRGAIFDPTHYANAAVDAVVERALATVDFEAREELYREAQRMALPEYPLIPLHHQVNVWALRKGLALRKRMQEGIRAWDVTPE